MSPTRTVRAAPAGGPWVIVLGYLPPGVNHMYHHVGTRLVLTDAAKRFRRDVELLTALAKFAPRKGKFYAMEMDFTFPDWRGDLDGPIKAVCDAALSSRSDNRIVRLTARKRVVKGVEGTCIRIVECAASGEDVDNAQEATE